MNRQQTKIHPHAEVDVNTGLKATTLTAILEIYGMGNLLGMYVTDPDNLTQNERLQIAVDGVALINDVAFDIPNTDFWLFLKNSITKQTFEGTATCKEQVTYEPISFKERLAISYLRAAAGTTGLTINILYEIEEHII